MTELPVRVSPPTQLDRVLALLIVRARERRPVNPTDFLGSTSDGGKPILRLPSRISDLRERGYRIDTVRAANGTADYYLRGEPVDTAPPAPPELEPVPESMERLFDAPPAVRHPDHEPAARWPRRGRSS